MSRNGRPEPEVIMNYADGFAYSKGKMEEAFRPGGILEKPPTKPAKDPNAPPIKREDIDLIVHELGITRAQAEKALAENGGDVSKALLYLITPQ
ncbi:hypothetical protein CCMSSC00406_0005809 [Pleurotus cornucopiae]|uniref:Uncharacterized protein n=1 Tax=Pleurotus cornucopiae TaxID=5321 RepID=A0ACB7J9Q7_PLECO|nr:hypothetical protein CCMSSC00406_0005809 [Pleurotus cornucopiae]